MPIVLSFAQRRAHNGRRRFQSRVPRPRRGFPERVPGYLIARLALHRELHHQRLGSQLLASALTRAAFAAREIGGRSVVVDAIDDAAAQFYEHHGFPPIAAHPDRLILATKALDGVYRLHGRAT